MVDIDVNRKDKTLTKRIRRLLSFYARLYLMSGPPILVYQMGKVGSSSVKESLWAQALPVFHVHRMNPVNIQRVHREYLENDETPPNDRKGKMLYNSIVRKGRRAKFISLVREPVGRNISAFFENFKRFVGVKYAQTDFTIERLAATFIDAYRHTVPLMWFDWEVKSVLGIDIYQHPFSQERGWLVVEKGNFELLVIKLEIEDSRKESAIADFLGLDEFKLVRANVAREKKYAKMYQDFLRVVKLPKAYIEIMCSAEYTRHFYSDSEIESIRSKWHDHIEAIELPSNIRQELMRASSRDWA
jgi:hypothetical protein